MINQSLYKTANEKPVGLRYFTRGTITQHRTLHYNTSYSPCPTYTERNTTDMKQVNESSRHRSQGCVCTDRAGAMHELAERISLDLWISRRPSARVCVAARAGLGRGEGGE